MQAVIMAAGRGSRLSPLTDDLPKSLLKIGGDSILGYQIRMYQKFGIENITIVTGYKHEQIENYVKKISSTTKISKITTTYNPFFQFTNVLASFWLALKNLSEEFIFSHADTIFDIPIMEGIMKANGLVALPINIGPCDKEAMKVEVNKSRKLTRISKNIPLDKALGEFIGVAKISASIIPKLTRCTKKRLESGDLSAYFEDALQDLILEDNSPFELLDINGHYWAEIDFLEDYQKALEQFPKSSLSKLLDHHCNQKGGNTQ